ncbi:hypothetical protein LYNGBM3L_74900 [Moorena producens 3L]|uniref:Uncharacterized protein n=1 Tax=Moorena producens 3L TaxID=489825 RepID=F4Y492_9CYAN|nr:hypothetical protein LYNGBM3L_74900 [Moorena producens 3L]
MKDIIKTLAPSQGSMEALLWKQFLSWDWTEKVINLKNLPYIA